MSNMAPYDLWLDNTQQNSVPANMNSLRNEVDLISVTNTLNTPVGSEAENVVLIVGAAPTGAFAGWANRLAIKKSGVWFDFSPVIGQRKWHQALATHVRWTGSAWVPEEQVFGAKGADLASAATVTLANATGDFAHITGTTTITSFGTATKAGQLRTLVFDGILTLTNGANLILPGGANIVTAAGDTAIVRSESTTIWRVIGYFRAAGGADMGAGTKADFWRGDKTFSSELQNDAGAMALGLRAYGGSAGYSGGRINGTPGAPTATLLGEQLTSQAGFGHDGTNETANKVRVRMLATQDWTPTSTPTRITFDTTPVGSTTITQRWSVEDTGHWLPTIDATYDAGSATFRLRATFTQTLNLSGALYETGVETPATAVADINDMALGANTKIIRVTTDAARALSGIVAGGAGRRITLVNANTAKPNTITLKYNGTGSSAANRFMIRDNSDLVLNNGSSVDLWYDTVNSRWRVVAPDTQLYGTYVPTLTGVANVAASTAYAAQWSRIGNVVTVSGRVDIDPTAASVNTELGISLPVASVLANDFQCCGSASPVLIAGVSAGILGDAVNNRATLRYLNAADVTNRSWFYHYTYLVL